MFFQNQLAGTLSAWSTAQAAGTKATALIQPLPPGQSLGTGTIGRFFPHINKIVYTTAGTAHTVYVLRPLNYTTLSADAAAAQAVLALTANPGTFSTNYKYATPNGGAAVQTADLTPASGHYAVYQLPDGTWQLDTISSISSLNFTMTTNVPTGGAKKGALFYYYGLVTSTDPATALAHWNTLTIASTNRQDLLQTDNFGSIAAFHAGDPLIVISNNITAAGSIDYVGGYYGLY